MSDFETPQGRFDLKRHYRLVLVTNGIACVLILASLIANHGDALLAMLPFGVFAAVLSWLAVAISYEVRVRRLQRGGKRPRRLRPYPY